MSKIRTTSNPIQSQGKFMSHDPQDESALQKAIELINTQKRLGLSLTIFDKNLNKIAAKFDNMADLLYNPEFISKLSQEFFVSNNNATTWFKLKLRNGRLVDITFLLTLHINWVKIINRTRFSYRGIHPGRRQRRGSYNRSSSFRSNS